MYAIVDVYFKIFLFLVIFPTKPHTYNIVYIIIYYYFPNCSWENSDYILNISGSMQNLAVTITTHKDELFNLKKNRNKKRIKSIKYILSCKIN